MNYSPSADIITAHLKDNPCRGIVLGMTTEGVPIQLSWIMGRSENSQNRVYVVDLKSVRTEAADPKKVKDPSLIIYDAMVNAQGTHIVGNGDQTITARNAFEEKGLVSPQTFQQAMGTRYCEPDFPTLTPRITGYTPSAKAADGTSRVHLSLIRADRTTLPDWLEMQRYLLEEKGIPKDTLDAEMRSRGLDRHKFPSDYATYARIIHPGLGYCLTTYMPGSKTLPSFVGEPIPVPIQATVDETMTWFWNLLDDTDGWKVSLAGKEIGPHGIDRVPTPINKHSRVVVLSP